MIENPMIDQIPIDVWSDVIAEFLFASDLCVLRAVSREMKTKLKKFDKIRIAGTAIITDVLRRKSQTCYCCGAIFRNLEDHHYRNFPRHDINSLSYRLPSAKAIYLRAPMDIACANDQCMCPTPQFTDLRSIYQSIMLETIYGCLLIKNISFWIGGVDFGYPHFITNEIIHWNSKMPKIRIYRWKEHFWISFVDEPYIILRIFQIRLVI